jgi:hypothetical protein
MRERPRAKLPKHKAWNERMQSNEAKRLARLLGGIC